MSINSSWIKNIIFGTIWLFSLQIEAAPKRRFRVSYGGGGGGSGDGSMDGLTIFLIVLGVLSALISIASCICKLMGKCDEEEEVEEDEYSRYRNLQAKAQRSEVIPQFHMPRPNVQENHHINHI